VALSTGLLQLSPFNDVPALVGAMHYWATKQHAAGRNPSGFELLSQLLWDFSVALTVPPITAPNGKPWTHAAFAHLPFDHLSGDPEPSSEASVALMASSILGGSCRPASPMPSCAADYVRTVSSQRAGTTYSVSDVMRAWNQAQVPPSPPPSPPSPPPSPSGNPTVTAGAGAVVPSSSGGSFYTVDECLTAYPGEQCPVKCVRVCGCADDSQRGKAPPSVWAGRRAGGWVGGRASMSGCVDGWLGGPGCVLVGC
jgi:hypothetical protein